MYDAVCYDKYGNIVNHMTQWDINQSVYVDIIDEMKSTKLPRLHLTNTMQKIKYEINAHLSNDKIRIDIPNELLKYPYPIIIYFYNPDYIDDNNQKTILILKLPVVSRNMPSDYTDYYNGGGIGANVGIPYSVCNGIIAPTECGIILFSEEG